MVNPLSYFMFQPVLHNWCNKGITKAVVCAILSMGMVHINDPLLLIGKSSPCGCIGFPLSYQSGPLPYV